MSRIGRKPIKIPNNVEVEANGKVTVKGSLGELYLKLPQGISLEKNDDTLVLKAAGEDKQTKAFHGLARSLLANMIEGVSNGFMKRLELSGIGFRATITGNKLTLNVGYSHPVEVEPPEGIKFEVAENKITVSGIDKQLVGRVAAEIRRIRKPDAYKGKGIRYEGEKLRLKPGKAAKAGVKVGA